MAGQLRRPRLASFLAPTPRPIQAWIGRELDERPGQLDVLSVCAGDGRDVIDVLASRLDAARVRGVLVELHRAVADLARERAQAAGLTSIEIREADAAETDNYVGAVPADLVLLVGVLGNISHEDLDRTLAATPQFCKNGALLIWSRGRDRDDLNDHVRAHLFATGFEEVAYEELNIRSWPALGAMRFTGRPAPLEQDQRLFTFWR